MKTILVAVYGVTALLALLGGWVYPAAKLGAQLAAGAFALQNRGASRKQIPIS